MPKMKTHKSSQKRFKKTGTGKFKRSHAFTSHLFRNKSKDQKRRLAKQTTVDKSDEARLNKLMPYK
ncbi:50S ribosomal protein L35 [Alkalibacillus sp. S2W]|uniref:Large ribosomal subunit protein bL35 n=1 Tax=Alkalibacillus salilacus TaxID=284582 RepID=A0ABT9VGW7_9BACI|nr:MULTISPECIES: 50S ribosomal protein L35 [Alkalibacillus]MDQ0160212.1 large subunit ribosomal protein L35 [Alkalibacillus salilacus]NIK11102.1 large subunit ribosomal protein L35 [Alkalibacillus almallahensis]